MTPPIRIGKRSAGLSGAGQDWRGVEVAGSGWRSGTRAGALDGGMRSSPFAKKTSSANRAILSKLRIFDHNRGPRVSPFFSLAGRGARKRPQKENFSFRLT